MAISRPTKNASAKLVQDWTDVELAAAIDAYLQMLKSELEGRPYVKSAINKALREGPLAQRKKGAIEFRMQNISATLYDLRLPHIAGYLPAKNVGSGVKDRIKALLERSGLQDFRAYAATADRFLLDERVSVLLEKPLGAMPRGAASPAQIRVQTTTFVRDPTVKRWVLQVANGFCEGCASPAPFVGLDGYPYLEVHHVMPLGSHGSDRVSNAVALCPNCHRRCHFASDRDEFKLSLYEKIARLEIEAPVLDNVEQVFITGLD